MKRNVSTFTNKIIDADIRFYIQFIVIMGCVTHSLVQGLPSAPDGCSARGESVCFYETQSFITLFKEACHWTLH